MFGFLAAVDTTMDFFIFNTVPMRRTTAHRNNGDFASNRSRRRTTDRYVVNFCLPNRRTTCLLTFLLASKVTTIIVVLGQSMVMWYFEQEFLSKQVAPLIILRYLVPGDISKRMCRGKGVQKTFGAMNHCMLTYTCQYNREWENLTQSYF